MTRSWADARSACPARRACLKTAHKKWGKLPWARLFQPAIKLADEGFAISPRLNGLLSQEKFLAANDAAARAYFFEADGKPKAVGTILKNPAYAVTLRTIAEKGADAYYSGAIAEDIVATVKGHATNPGDMTLADLAAYKVIERPAVCGPYRTFTLCGMGPPSSGAVAVQQIMAVLATKDIARMGMGPEAVTGSPRRAGWRLQIVRFISATPPSSMFPSQDYRSRLSEKPRRPRFAGQIDGPCQGGRPAAQEGVPLRPLRRHRERYQPYLDRRCQPECPLDDDDHRGWLRARLDDEIGASCSTTN